MSQEARSSLEKGLTPPASLLFEAAKIAGVDLDNSKNFSIGGLAANSKSASPTREWVLRWLLKKLKSPENIDALTLGPQTWVLVNQLLQRIALKNAARILNEQDFMKSLETASRILDDALSPKNAAVLGSVGSKQLVSSSPAVKNVSSQPNRKRKRSSNDAQVGVSVPGLALLPILQAVKVLVSLIDAAPDNVSAQHGMLALRSEASVVASTLGHLTSSTAKYLEEQNATPEQSEAVLAALQSVLKIWTFRSQPIRDVSDQASNEAFNKFCLVPMLQLLSYVRGQDLDTSANQELLEDLERLIAYHVISPMRSTYFQLPLDSRNGGFKESDSQVEAIFPQLQGLTGQTQHVQESMDGVSQAHMVKTNILSVLYDIGIRTSPRDNIRRQQNEAPWLEVLFIALCRCAGQPLSGVVTTQTIPTSNTVLESLLKVAERRRVSLSLELLGTLTSRHCGILDYKTHTCSWSLLAQVLKLDSNVLIPNAGFSEAEGLLNATFAKISKLDTPDDSKSSETTEIIKSKIIIPLLNGFARARDLISFVQLWHEQLSVAMNKRSESQNLIWEDEDLIAAFVGIAKSSLTLGQIKEQFQELLRTLDGAKDRDGQAGIDFAQVLIADATLQTIQHDLSFLSEIGSMTSLGAIVSHLLQNSVAKSPDQWRLWQLLQHLNQDLSLLSQEANLQAQHSPISVQVVDKALIGTALAMVQTAFSREEGENASQATNMEALQAFTFVVQSIIMLDLPDSEIHSHSEKVIEALVGLLNGPAPRRKGDFATWNGRPETLTSSSSLAVACLGTVMRYIRILIHLTPRLRQQLLRNTFRLAQGQYVEETESDISEHSPSYLEIWNALLRTDVVVNMPPVCKDILEVILSSMPEITDITNIPEFDFAVTSLLEIPSEVLPRGMSTKLSERLLSTSLGPDAPLGQALWSKTMAALVHTMRHAEREVRLIADWDDIWILAEELDSSVGGHERSILEALKDLVGIIWPRLLSNLDGGISQNYLSNLYPKCRTVAAKPLGKRPQWYTFQVLMEFSRLLWKDRGRLTFMDHQSERLREAQYKTLIARLESQVKHLQKDYTSEVAENLVVILSLLGDFADLCASDEKLSKTFVKIEKTALDAKTHDNMTLRLTSMSLKHQLSAAEREDVEPDSAKLQGSMPIVQLTECADVLQSMQTQTQVHETLRLVRRITSSAAPAEMLQAVQGLQEVDFASDPGPNRLLVISTVLSTMRPQQSDDEPSDQISSLLSKLSAAVSKATQLDQFMMITECIKLVLRKYRSHVKQWNIDDLLSSVVTTASEEGPRLTGVANQAGSIYTQLCQVIGILLGQYRKKLGGRFQLVIPVLQSLLRCLFQPESSKSKALQSMSNTPPWLAQSQNTLGAIEATHFARLLTSICDPTASSVQKRKKGGSLTDETRKVKSIAGQYMQYVVAEYTRCQLSGRISPEVKAALMPGFYAVLDAMPREVMRTMNAAMDSSNRAIFKGLYDDYIRFGRWDQS